MTRQHATQAAEAAVLLIAVAWYALVLYKTWPVGLSYWPLWVLAYAIVTAWRV
jgi:hypothetical protein